MKEEKKNERRNRTAQNNYSRIQMPLVIKNRITNGQKKKIKTSDVKQINMSRTKEK